METNKRKQIYNKYNGRCAYCGDKIDYKDMQVDHIKPKYLGGTDDIENLMPSCRACNFYKSTFSLEDFRKRLMTIPKRLEKNLIYRLSKKYGFVKQFDYGVWFWFERVEYEKSHPEEDWA